MSEKLKQKYLRDSEGNLCVSAVVYLRKNYNCSPQRAKQIAKQMAVQEIVQTDDSGKCLRYLIRVNNQEDEEAIDKFMQDYKGPIAGEPKPQRGFDLLCDKVDQKEDNDWIVKMNKGRLSRKSRVIRVPCFLKSGKKSNCADIKAKTERVLTAGEIRSQLESLTLGELSFRDFMGYLVTDQNLTDKNDPYREQDSILELPVLGMTSNGEQIIGYEEKNAKKFIDFVIEDFKKRQGDY